MKIRFRGGFWAEFKNLAGFRGQKFSAWDTIFFFIYDLFEDINGETALYKAICRNNHDVVRQLASDPEFGLQIVNILNYDLISPLECAMKKDFKVITDILSQQNSMSSDEILRKIGSHDNNLTRRQGLVKIFFGIFLIMKYPILELSYILH